MSGFCDLPVGSLTPPVYILETHQSVRVISRKAIADFAKKLPEALKPLTAWFVVTETARWTTFVDPSLDFPSADQVGRRTVFNTGGNKFRLIARVNYEAARVYILHILIHLDYDKDGWK